MFRMLRSVLCCTLLVSAAAQAQEPPPPPPEAAPSPEAAPPPEAPPPAPAAPAKPAKTPVQVTYDKGTIFKSEDDAFELKLTGRLQSRLEVFRSTADGAEFISRFLIVRGRLTMEGHAFGKDNGYKAEFSFSDKGNPIMKDFFLDKGLGGGVRLRIGQWKKPFNRQEIISDFALELAERALDNDFASGGRDIGVGIHNGYEKSPGIEWVVALMNGTGEKPSQKATTTCQNPMDPSQPPICTTTIAAPSNVPTDWRPLIVARVGWNSEGLKGYSEADLEGGGPRAGVGASYRLDMHGSTKGGDWSHGVEGDVIFKMAGFDANAALIFLKDPDVDGKIGFHLQAGHFVLPKQAQVFARFAMVPRAGVDGENTLEVRGGFAWYFAGHNLKVLTDGGALSDTGNGGKTEVQIRSQAQLVF